MSDASKIRINLKSGEIEIQGSEEFVERQIDNLETLLELLASPYEDISSREKESADQNGIAPESENVTSSDFPETFGEWFHGFPRDINDLDKTLAAAYFIQRHSEGNEFKTSEITKILKQHGIRLSNTSSSIKRLVTKKHIFPTRKSGKISYFRVSRTGEEHLNSITN